MEQVNIHEAKTHLSRLIERALLGESFVIAKAGKPLVQVTPIGAPGPRERLGFLTGEMTVPADFDLMGASEIEDLFEGRP